MRNVFGYNDGAVYHHPHRQDKARQGNDVQRYLTEIEKEESDDNGRYHADTDDYRRAYIAQEEDGHDEDEQESQREVVLQVRYGIVQQFGLVTAHLELDVRIERAEVVGRFLQLGLHGIHVLVALLDDGQGYCPLATGQRHALLLLAYHRHFGQFLQLHQPIALAYVDVLHILRRT